MFLSSQPKMTSRWWQEPCDVTTLLTAMCFLRGWWSMLPLFLLHLPCFSEKSSYAVVVYPWRPWRTTLRIYKNAKRHMGVSLIAAVSYQSLKQIAYQLHSYVLDMSTMLCRGDLSKIMHIKDDGTRLIHFKVNWLFRKKKMEMQCICRTLIILIITITVAN